MPKLPVTISIVPSRWRRRGHLGLALMTSLLLALYAPPWLLAAAVLFLGLVLGLVERRLAARWQLRWVPDGAGGGEWQRRLAGEMAWTRASLRLDYLGPWLVGLRLDGRRHWLWPDSAEAESLRRLRCLLLEGGQRARH